MCSAKEMLYIQIMVFYAVLSYVVMPLLAFKGLLGPLQKVMGKKGSLLSAGKGFVTGSVVSVLLWTFVGSKMVV